MVDLIERLQEALADRYQIERELGSGGMAIVYLAEDLKHERQVALKVLRPELAAALGDERFLREIKIAANLTHPHILPLFDSGAVAGFLYYAMPYVEGESLRERLNREQQLPLEDALQIAQDVAAALSYAHGHDVVHRDIKPENILLSGDEAVVADFGVARAVSEAGGTKLTKTGIAVGTPVYMSPEQASGDRQIDGRSDVYALGCVLYEMLAGQPPFTGPTAQAITARKWTDAVPDLRPVRETVPEVVEHIVKKSLAKVAADRYTSADQFAEALQSAITPTATLVRTPVEAAKALSRPRRTRGAFGWRAATVVLTVMLVMVLWAPWRSDRLRPLTLAAFPIAVPAGLMLDQSGFGSPVAISRDGSKLAFVARGDGTTRIYVRSLPEVEPTLLLGTEGATAPFFSPDGNWVGFFAGGFLKRVSLLGGAPQVICEAPGPRSGVWEGEGTIIMGSAGNAERFLASASPNWQFTPDQAGLERVTVSGGDREGFSRSEGFVLMQGVLQTEHWPQLLPNGKGVLYTLFNAPGWEPGSMQIGVYSFETGERSILVESGTSPTYVETGHILYAWQGELRAAPFDLETLEVTGTAVAVVTDVAMTVIGSAFYSISHEGTLVYVPGEVGQVGRSFVLVDRDGNAEPVPLAPGFYQSPRVSPDGSRFVFSDYRSFWSYDLGRGTLDRFTDDAGTEFWAVWSPNGERLIFNSNRHGGPVANGFVKSV